MNVKSGYALICVFSVEKSNAETLANEQSCGENVELRKEQSCGENWRWALFVVCSDENNTASGSYMYNVGRLFNQKLDDGGNKSIDYGEYPDKCIPDLSTEDCHACLNEDANSFLDSIKGKQGGRCLNPSCNLRYELYPFYRDPTPTAVAPAPSFKIITPATTANLSNETLDSGSKRKKERRAWIPIAITASSAIVVMLISYFLWRMWRKNKRDKGDPSFNFLANNGKCRFREGRMGNDYPYGDFQGEKQMDSQEFPLFPLGLALEATQHFSDENKLGEGGFVPVYKVYVIGYMAPEYAMEGLFSAKSDVFSFGVLVLEIISGRKDSGFHLSKPGLIKLTKLCLEPLNFMVFYGYAKKAIAYAKPLSFICPSDQNNTASTNYMYNVGQLFNRRLYDEGNKSIYYYGADPDKVYGVYLCRFDITQETCQNCIANATDWLVQECNSNKTAIAWFDECMVRYSNISSFSSLETSPSVFWWNEENITQPDEFNEILKQTLFNAIVTLTLSASNHATHNATISKNKKVYSLVQCLPALSIENCRACLNEAAYSLLEIVKGKQGGRWLNPSCNIRYEIYPFYRDPATTDGAPAPNNGDSGSKRKKASRAWIPIAITALAVVVVLLSYFLWHMWRKNKRDKEERANSQEIQLIRSREGRMGNNYSYGDLQGEKRMESQEFPGYMAPEYPMEGLFSVKLDVFSFGVLLLEIISGRKNSGFHLSEPGLSLLNYVCN
ncbi:hypothetical protein EZV62_026415 [Acer yangbiense]|uniref:Gnk2-homologous domain-containing protein n=1 Tax=Acer yangbiense TaxID=1000413 RepID=A0A5C7GQP0_9ROSI|nr:hypothetical protein EZV62_026415 [Acer yangbiense]